MSNRRKFLEQLGGLVSAALLPRALQSSEAHGQNFIDGAQADEHAVAKSRRCVIAIGYDIERMFESEELYFTRNPPPRKEVSYPGPKWNLTPECIQYVRKLMDIADRHSVKIQFFALGHSVEASPGIFHEILTRKHHLGQHTYSHLALTANLDEVMDDVSKTQEIFIRELGLKPFGLRAPGMYKHGIDSLQELQTKLKAVGIQYVSTLYDESRRMEEMQPYLFPTGLLEIPGYGTSDRNYSSHLGNTLSQWTRYVRSQVQQACEKKLFYSPDLHPCLEAVLDPEGTTIETMIETARENSANAWITSLDDVARQVLRRNDRHE